MINSTKVQPLKITKTEVKVIVLTKDQFCVSTVSSAPKKWFLFWWQRGQVASNTSIVS